MNKAARLITLIMLMQRKPNQKAAELAAELGVSIRTVHRYFCMLDEMGIPVYAERGPSGGFSLVPGYRMPPLVFSPTEAAAVVLGTDLVSEMWGRLYAEEARSAAAKIENLLPPEQQAEIAWARRSLVATGFHHIESGQIEPTLEMIRHAIHIQSCLEIAYQNPRQTEAHTRTVQPYALVHRWGWWYLVAFCQQRKAIRTFRIDRIRSCKLVSERFQFPPGFDIRTYLTEEFENQPQTFVRLRIDGKVISSLDNKSYWESIEPQDDGSLIVSFHTPELHWVVNMVLTASPGISVLEPDSVRQMVYERAIRIARINNQPEKEINGKDRPEEKIS